MLFIKDKIKSSFPMKEEKKLLIITGAGASRSLMKDLPTGGELITGLKSYKNKSIAWLLGYCALRMLDGCKYREGFFQRLERLLKDHDRMSADCGVENSPKIVSLIRDQVQYSLKYINSHTINTELNDEFRIMCGKLVDQIITIDESNHINTDSYLYSLYDSLEIKGKAQYLESHPEPLYQIVDSYFGPIRLSVEGVFKKDNIESMKAIIEEFITIVKKIVKVKPFYEQGPLIEFLKDLNNFTKYLDDINLKQILKVVEDVKGCYFAASLIERYNPESIDYFMMNLESFAHNEFVDLPTSKTEEGENSLSSKTKEELIEYIHKYTKFMIVDYLVSGKNLEVTKLHKEDNYIKKLQWIILKKAKFYKKDLSEYLKDNVDFINFNYETSLEDSLKELLPKESLMKEINYVYGKIDIKDNKGTPISNISQDGIWGSIFLQSIRVNLPNPNIPITHPHPPDPYQEINNIFDQCRESIKWIGEVELEEKRKKYHKLFKDADEIYFLGFGFDINNLYQLGILDENEELEQDLKKDQLTKKKKIFISGGNAKIITLLKEKFDIENESSTILGQSIEGAKSKNIGIYRLQNKKYDIRVSPQHLPDALSEDL
jgi:hypothetical protein